MPESLAVAVDFGSTFTKVRAVAVPSGRLVASAQSLTTVRDGLLAGLDRALAQARVARSAVDAWYACSSAAGGLRIVAIGLVRNLTAEAARRASLGAGGRVVGAYAGQLTRSDLAQIVDLVPDLVVLAGGTDGGDRATICRNAALIAQLGLSCPVIVAGNRAAADEVADTLAAAAVDYRVVDNVMPRVDVLEPAACSAAIRRVFIERIVLAKGFEEAQEFIGRGLVPTPNAVLEAFALVAQGTQRVPGLIELVGIDVGGATTDVYSVAEGRPTTPRAAQRGLAEPYLKRTVEGDLGVRVSAPAVVQAGRAELPEGNDVVPSSYANRVAREVGVLPGCDDELGWDVRLAAAAALIATRRHAGRLELGYGVEGSYYLQYGKDLTAVPAVIGTGGVLSGRARDPADCARVLGPVVYHGDAPDLLLPRAPRRYVDREYVLYAAGLLAADHPDAAATLARASLTEITVA